MAIRKLVMWAFGLPVMVGIACNVVVATARGEPKWAFVFIALWALNAALDWRAKRKAA